MGGGKTVGGDHGPAVGERLHAVGAEIDHGFDGEGHAGFDLLPGAAAAEVRNLRLLMHRAADAVADQVADDAETARLDQGLDGMGDVADAIADLRLADADVEGFLGGLKQAGDFRSDGTDGHRDGVVADVPVGFDGDIERDDVAIAEDALEGADAVDHLLVDREAGVGGKAPRTDLIADSPRCGRRRLAIRSRPAWSRSNVLMPGCTSALRRCSTVAAMAHESRMRAMASRSLMGIISGGGFRPNRERRGWTRK